MVTAAAAAAALAVDEFADNAYDAGVALVAVAFDDEKHEIMNILCLIMMRNIIWIRNMMRMCLMSWR